MEAKNSYGAGLNSLMSVEAKQSMKDDRFPEVLFGEPFYYFLDHMRALNKKSVLVYKRRLAEFLIYHQSNTVDFYKYVVENKNPKDSRDKDATKKLLDDYCSYLMNREDEPYMFNTVLTYVYAFNHFLEGNDQGIRYRYMPPRTLTPEEYLKKVVPNGADRISREKINELLTQTANPQYRSILMMLKDSGLRASDISQLTFKHIRKALQDPAPDYITFEILPIKNMNMSGIIANPVLGPDAIKFLRIWLVYKKRKYEERFEYEKRLLKKAQTWKMYGAQKDLVPKEYPYTENDEDYIYCYMETKKGHVRTDGTVITGRSFGEKLDQGAAANIVQVIKRKDKAAFKKLSAHSFRKAHATGLTSAHVPERWVNVMQGKKGEGTQGIYIKPNEEEIIEEYAAGYSKIALAKEENQKITELENQVTVLREMMINTLIDKDQKVKWEALKNPPA